MDNNTHNPEPTGNDASSDTTEQKPVDRPILTTSVSPDFKLPIDETNSKRKTIIIVVTSILLVLGVFAGAMYALLQLNEKTQTPTVQTNTPIVQTPVTKTFDGKTAAATVQSIQANIKSTLLKQSTDVNKQNHTVAAYQVNGAKYAVYPQKDQGIASTGTTETVNTDYDATLKTLKDNEFKSLATSADGTQDRTDKYEILASNKVVCFVHNTPTEVNAKTAQFSLGCGDISDYTVASEAIQPFYDALVNTKVKNAPKVADVDGLILGNPNISDGTDGYKNAQLSVSNSHGAGGYGASFYRSATGTWTFAFAGQDAPQCSSFNTPELQKGFTGISCYDTKGEVVSYKPTAA